MIKAISIKDGVRRAVEIEPISDIVLEVDDIEFIDEAIRSFGFEEHESQKTVWFVLKAV